MGSLEDRNLAIASTIILNNYIVNFTADDMLHMLPFTVLFGKDH